MTWGDYYARSSWFMAVLFLAVLLGGMLWTWDQARDRIREERRAAQAAAEAGDEDAG